MAKFAAGTDVTVGRTREEIERTLTRYGATGFGFMTQQDPPAAVILFQYAKRNYRIDVPLPSKDDARQRGSNQYRDAGDFNPALYEQLVRQRWRAVALYIKATLEAVESGIVKFEAAFLAAAMLPDGRTTVGEWAEADLADAYRAGRMPLPMPGMPNRLLPPGPTR